jgi:hypothetical protein
LPAIASTQFEAIENRSQVADAARWGSDFKGFPSAIASTQFEAIENGSQVERFHRPDLYPNELEQWCHRAL